MQEKIYISERQEGFKAHQSLTDKPLVFETSGVKGAIFYLPFEQPLGGDSFVVKADDSLTISLLEDMTGDGIDARKKLRIYSNDLKQIIEIASSNIFENKRFLEEIVKLDMKVDPHNLLAFSFIRILPNGTICYLNIGENQLMIYKDGKTYNFSDMSEGKIGALNLRFNNKQEIMQKIGPHYDVLKPKDKILLCSDGILDYIKDSEYIARRTNEVETLFALPIGMEEIISKINACAIEELKTRQIEKVNSDYTILGLQLK